MTEFQKKVLANTPVGYEAKSLTAHGIAAKIYDTRPNRGHVSAVSRALYKLRNQGKVMAEIRHVGYHYTEVRWWRAK